MGDLKRKNVDYIVQTPDGGENLIEVREIYSDEKTIARLREYIELFYEKQVEKIEKEEEEKWQGTEDTKTELQDTDTKTIT